MTGSDDGYIFFWNIPYDLINQARSQQAALQGEKKLAGSPQGKLSMIRRASHAKFGQGYSRRIPEFKPKYELYLTGYAQIQCLLIHNELIVALDNDNTVSMIKTSFSHPAPSALEADQESMNMQEHEEDIHNQNDPRRVAGRSNIPQINQSSGSRNKIASNFSQHQNQTPSKGSSGSQPFPQKFMSDTQNTHGVEDTGETDNDTASPPAKRHGNKDDADMKP